MLPIRKLDHLPLGRKKEGEWLIITTLQIFSLPNIQLFSISLKEQQCSATKVLLKYERPKWKVFLSEKLHFCWAYLFIFDCLYFIRALVYHGQGLLQFAPNLHAHYFKLWDCFISLYCVVTYPLQSYLQTALVHSSLVWR